MPLEKKEGFSGGWEKGALREIKENSILSPVTEVLSISHLGGQELHERCS